MDRDQGAQDAQGLTAKRDRAAPNGSAHQVVLDRALVVIAADRALADAMSFSLTNIIGRPFVALIDAGDRERFDRAARVCLEDGAAVSGLTLALLRADERKTAFVARLDRAEDPPRLIVDLSSPLPASTTPDGDDGQTELLASIVAASSDAIFSVSSAGVFLSWNRGAEQLYGFEAAEVVGQPLQMIVPPDRLAESAAFASRILKGENVDFEAIRRHKDGGGVEVAVSASPIYDSARRIVGIASVHRDVRAKNKQETQLRFLLRELAHRTKNLLAIIQSIERQTARGASSLETFHEQFSSRLRALAASHDLLVDANWLGASIGDLVERQLAPFLDDVGDRVFVQGPPLRLSPEAAQTIGLAVHELGANATAYGALSAPGGRVSISWGIEAASDGEQQTFRMEWLETGGPRVAEPTRRGFGSMAIERLAAQALNGKVDLRYEPEGVRWTLRADAAQVEPLPD